MDLIGQPIRHKTFGNGVITGLDDNILTVCFGGEESKKFFYPEAFESFLTFGNRTLQGRVCKVIHTMSERKEAKALAFQKKQEKENRLLNLKISQSGQAAFHVDAADEDRMFCDWAVKTGVYLSGGAKGEPRIPERLKPNSMCLLTACGEEESLRRVIGAFMVPDDFFGTCCPDGVIRAHPTFRIRLEGEARTLFWPYFAAEKKKPAWGRTTMKYFSNRLGEAILFDILKGAEGRTDRGDIARFYQYYCRLNHLVPRRAAG